MSVQNHPRRASFHRLRAILSCALPLVAGVLLCQCTDTDDTSSWDYDTGRAADGESDTEEPDAVSPDAESCNRDWRPADDFKEDADCDDDEFRYEDTMCALGPSDAGAQCNRVGDGRCYQKCETDADCTNPERPHCSVLGLWDSGDYNCNDSVKICRSTCRDDCPAQ